MRGRDTDSRTRTAIWVAVIGGAFTLCGTIVAVIGAPIIRGWVENQGPPQQFDISATPGTQEVGPIPPTNTGVPSRDTTTPLEATEIPAPTDTPTVTPTSTITATATLSLQLPFEDDFGQDIRPEWKIVDGEYVIENGQLGSATNWLTLEIGDAALGSKYTVEFDYDGVNDLYVTIGGKVRHYSTRYSSAWQARQDNNWVKIGSASGKGFSGSMRLTVDGNFYSVYLSYRDFTGPIHDSLDTIIYGEPLQGPLSIRFSKGVFIDNFSITMP